MSDATSQVYLLSFRKSFRKRKKTIEDQEQKQVKTVEDHGKQSIESDEIIKKDFISVEIVYYMKNQKKLINFFKKSLINLII